jgi:hypothetical protein
MLFRQEWEDYAFFLPIYFTIVESDCNTLIFLCLLCSSILISVVGDCFLNCIYVKACADVMVAKHLLLSTTKRPHFLKSRMRFLALTYQIQ